MLKRRLCKGILICYHSTSKCSAVALFTSNGVSCPVCTYDNGPSLTKLRVSRFGGSLFPTVKLRIKENIRMTTVLLLFLSQN